MEIISGDARVDAVRSPEVGDQPVSRGGDEGEADIQTRPGYHLQETVTQKTSSFSIAPFTEQIHKVLRVNKIKHTERG